MFRINSEVEFTKANSRERVGLFWLLKYADIVLFSAQHFFIRQIKLWHSGAECGKMYCEGKCIAPLLVEDSVFTYYEDFV